MTNTSRSFKLLIIGVLLIFASLIPYYYGLHQVKEAAVIRAAIDIGSGATKLKVAVVDLENQKILKTLVDEQRAVSYQQAILEGDEMRFDEELMRQGIDAIQELKKIAMENQAEKVIGIATAAFRKAENGEDYVKRITEETGVEIAIIDQELEGELGFLAVDAAEGADENKMVVWDIGGGSLQLTMLGPERDIKIYRGQEASIPFRNYVIENIQGADRKTVKTPNPMTIDEMDRAEQHARRVAQSVDQIFKDKLIQPKTKVYGIGSIFSRGIEPLVVKNPFTALQLKDVVVSLAGKTDEELGGGDFVNVLLTNSLLVIGFMQELGINEVHVVDVNIADGAFFYTPFWTQQEAAK